MTPFRELFRLSVAHSYYAGACRDFEYIIPQETARMLKQGRLLAKVADGVLRVLFETDGSTAPLVSIAGTTLRFGLRLANPYFSNFTTVAADFHSGIQRYTYEDIDTIAPWPATPLVGEMFRHTLGLSGRPVLVSLLDANRTVVAERTIGEAEQTETGFDLSGRSAGSYTVRELYPTTSVETGYFVHGELHRQSAVVAVEITVDSALYAAANTFEVPFDAREEVLNYYVVVRNYSDADVDDMTIDDVGFTGDGRPEVHFKRIESGDFTSGELPPDLLQSGGDRIVLFRSASDLLANPELPEFSDLPIPRRDRGRKNIQLSKSGDPIIANLPQPGPDKANSDMIIHISKP